MKKFFGAAVAAAAVAVAVPASASAATDSVVGARGTAAATRSTVSAPAAGIAKSNTAYSSITKNFCGRINGRPYIGAQSRQSKYTTNTYSMTQTHTVQGFSNGRWIKLGTQKFVVNGPQGGVWYYAPSTTGYQLWDLSGWTGTFRVQVLFQWKTTSGTSYKATSVSPCTKA